MKKIILAMCLLGLFASMGFMQGCVTNFTPVDCEVTPYQPGCPEYYGPGGDGGRKSQ